MPIPRLVVPGPLRAGQRGSLTPDQTQQVRSVLRLSSGQLVALFDGSGVEATARLTSLHQSGAGYEIVDVARPAREPALDLTIGLALLRGDRFEVALQKLTELGIRRVVPIVAARSVVSFDDARAWGKRRDRYERIAREAAEQSERVTLLEVADPQPLAAFLEQAPVTALVERADEPPLATIPLEPQMALVVGPEGGWTDTERALLEERARQLASLGRLVLRAETAAIVAAGVLIQRAWAACD